MKRLLSLFCLLLFWSALYAKVTLPSIWGDGMVGVSPTFCTKVTLR